MGIFFCLCCAEAEPPPPTLRLYVDANRDGDVDDDYTNLDRWKAGAGQRRREAVILCNNDDNEDRETDDGAGYLKEDPTEVGSLDNTDTNVNGAHDVNDLAPLYIRRSAVPSSFKELRCWMFDIPCRHSAGPASSFNMTYFFRFFTCKTIHCSVDFL